MQRRSLVPALAAMSMLAGASGGGHDALEPLLPPEPPRPVFAGYAIRDDRGQFWNGSRWVATFDPRTCMFSEQKAQSIAAVLVGRYKHTKRQIEIRGVTRSA